MRYKIISDVMQSLLDNPVSAQKVHEAARNESGVAETVTSDGHRIVVFTRAASRRAGFADTLTGLGSGRPLERVRGS